MGNFRVRKYVLPNGTEVFLTVRPDVYPAEAELWLDATAPDVRFSFTDDLVRFGDVNTIGTHGYPPKTFQ